MNNRLNWLSFLFTAILIVSTFLSKADNSTKKSVSFQEDIKNSSLIASVQPNFISTQKPEQSILNTAFNTELELKPLKKEGVVNPALTAKIAYAKDLDSQKDFYASGTEKHWPIASISKLMTALIASEKVGIDKTVIISQSAIDTEGSAGNFKENEKYSIKDLIKIMLFVSSNDAAEAISEFYGKDAFVKEMNSEAVKIGMLQTNYNDCTGLSVLNQSTTSDLTKLAEYILKEKPEIFEYTKNKELSVVELSSNSVKFFTNINTFAGQPDFLGGKTGFIDSSEQNLLSLFNYKGHKILTIILGSEDRSSDTQKLLDWVKNSYIF